MLNEVRRLHALGFAIHLLRPRSKAPIESAWTKGPRKSFEELKKQYKPGMNIGVRLGRASELNPKDPKSYGFLAVIDCDVKSTDSRHLAEMEEKLEELFGGTLHTTPSVASGRGNGSRHYYVATEEPIAPKRLAQSKEKVKVLMPSVKHTKEEFERLSSLELEEGYRLRHAWEISLMGEGQQVVLPPSVHPDSGKQYMWCKPFELESLYSLVGIGEIAAMAKEKEVIEDFKAVEVDLTFTNLSPKIIRMIEDGDGVSDRSAALQSAMTAMAGCGLSDQEILSVLTDKRNFLGQVAFDRRGKSREKAAEWLRDYGLAKARKRVMDVELFENAVTVADLNEDAATAQAVEILEDSVCWKSKIERTQKDQIKFTLKNVMLILRHSCTENPVYYDLFYNTEYYTVDTPWGGQKGIELRDIDNTRIKVWLSEGFGFEPADGLIHQAVVALADQNQKHPVRDWIMALPKWDGTPRLDTWMKRLWKAEAPEPYLSAISRKVVVAMVARVFEPGVKFDHMLTLIGEQGILKSTSVRVLAEPWGSNAAINMGDKDSVLALRGAWILELGELAGLNRAEINRVKDFITRGTDRIRVPFGRRHEDFPRQGILMGTTNNTEILRDETGNRRFWIVRVGNCDVDALKAEREQLFAEAYMMYQFGEALYLSNEENEAAKIFQAQHMETDVLDERIDKLLTTKKDGFNSERFTMLEFFEAFKTDLSINEDRPAQWRVGRALSILGYRKRDLRDKAGTIRKTWIKPGTQYVRLPFKN